MAKLSSSEDLTMLIFSTGRLLKESIRHSHPSGMSLVQLSVLDYVIKNPDETMKDLAKHFSITPPSASEIVGPLVKNGYLKRVFNRRDKRIIRLRLTKKGEKLMNEGRKESQKILQKILSKLSEKEKNDLAKILLKIVSTI